MTNQVRLGKQKWTVKISISVAQDKGRKIITLLARSKLPPARTRIHLACQSSKRKPIGYVMISFEDRKNVEDWNYRTTGVTNKIWA